MEASSHAALTGIAAVALAALACGIAMTRLRQPAIVGYILAGVLLGPSGLGLVGNREEIHNLAELGVLMLLFLIGMELSLRNFRHIWQVAVGVTAIQIGVGVCLMLVCARLFGWSVPMALLLGFVVALSSTAVAVKILEDMGELRTHTGRIAVGVLVAQDLAVVPMILVVNGLAGDGFDWLVVPKVALSVAFLVVLILYLSAGRKIKLPFLTLIAGNVDLKPLAALAFCFCIAALSGFAGLSAAYGAFLAGLVIGNSAERHEMVAVTLPIQSILMMVFFLSIGLLLDLDYIWRNLGAVLFLFFLVAVVKTVLNVGALGLFGQSWQHAFLAGIMLAQIGEFSFVLAGIGAGKGVIGEDERRLIVAVTVLSLALSP
ncbi:MAG: cation:proton antiporter, partial [Rhodospirillaceae bacterium]